MVLGKRYLIRCQDSLMSWLLEARSSMLTEERLASGMSRKQDSASWT